MKLVSRRIAFRLLLSFVTLSAATRVDADQDRRGSQAGTSRRAGSSSVAPAPPPAAMVTPPPGYIIGPEDVLSIVFWRDKDITSDVVVRPDGMISLPLLNDVHAAGLTPEQLRQTVIEGAKRFLEEPSATVIVKQINSRKVFITGAVNKPGPYPLPGPTTVLQLIALAGGVLEFADSEHIVIVRHEAGRQATLQFNYKDVSKRKNLRQNIELKPGDTVIVP